MSMSWEQRVFRIRRILTDAGCSEEQIAAFLALGQAGERCRQYRLLARHRAALLEQLHSVSFSLALPLVSLALAAGLFLLCRLLERGLALQRDSDSII